MMNLAVRSICRSSLLDLLTRTGTTFSKRVEECSMPPPPASLPCSSLSNPIRQPIDRLKKSPRLSTYYYYYTTKPCTVRSASPTEFSDPIAWPSWVSVLSRHSSDAKAFIARMTGACRLSCLLCLSLLLHLRAMRFHGWYYVFPVSSVQCHATRFHAWKLFLSFFFPEFWTHTITSEWRQLGADRDVWTSLAIPMTRKRQRSVLKLFGLLGNWMKTEKHSKRKLHSSRLIHYAPLLAATSTNKSQSYPPSTPISSSCIPNWRACLESRLETTTTATARERSKPRKKREGKKMIIQLASISFLDKESASVSAEKLITKFEWKIVETKKRQAKAEELSLSRFQKSSCLLKQPKNSKKILKKKAINPEIKNPLQMTTSLRKVATRKMKSGNGLEKLKQGNRASRKTKFCVGGKQGKKRQLRSPSLRPFHARIVI